MSDNPVLTLSQEHKIMLNDLQASATELRQMMIMKIVQTRIINPQDPKEDYRAAGVDRFL